VPRPNRVAAEVTGDDGSDKLLFGGKTLVSTECSRKQSAAVGSTSRWLIF
jgi:hypothetical protein